MAIKETKNEPKDLVEATPEQVTELEKDPEVSEKLEELERVSETPAPETRESRQKTREQEERDKNLEHWIPKTELGVSVKHGKEKDLDKILEKGKRILEPEIVDTLIKPETDLILIGQAKGKFGGGKRRAWRQTQKKTQEGNILTFSSMAVIGDKKGHIGLGYGRSKETLPAREKALRKAKLNVIKITQGFETQEESKSDPHTVPFKVQGKCGSTRMTLWPAPRGTGLVIGDQCKKILSLAGIKDVYSKTQGHTRTTFNIARACIDALKKTNQEIK
tara:strand:- start:3440 stop:4267 length:828 start_codon:yes stop_codon:yes gene_type:complete